MAQSAEFPVKPFITWVAVGQWEDVTLRKAHVWSKQNPTGSVLYTHTKGAFHEWDTQAPWRKGMAERLMYPWMARLQDLTAYDTVGVWCVTPEEFPGLADWPYYPGNFWWARASYMSQLTELPVLTEETRGKAEGWVTSGNPVVHALQPGWPTFPV